MLYRCLLELPCYTHTCACSVHVDLSSIMILLILHYQLLMCGKLQEDSDKGIGKTRN